MFERIRSARSQPAAGVLLACAVIAAGCPAARSAGEPGKPSETAITRRAVMARNYSNLPLSFEVNRGQADRRVRFLSRGNGYGLFLTAKEAVLALHNPTRDGVRPSILIGMSRLSPHGVAPDASPLADHEPVTAGDSTQARFSSDVVRMELSGANPRANPVGVNPLPGTANYFLGSDPSRWRANVPTYSRVCYPGVYPGIDLIYYGNQGQLEYDFVVAPGADPKAIRLHFSGARALKLDSDGNLAIVGQNGSLAFRKPSIYQTLEGVRHPVAGSFKLLSRNIVGFSVDAYDRSKPLVIDPILAYSTYFGGTNAEFVVAVTSDATGAAYVTGLTISENFPLTAGAFQAVNYATPANAVSTAFISKFNASGTALLYSTYLGGVAISNTLHEQGDYGKAIAVDSSGNAYVTGYTYSTDFPITSHAFQKGNIPAETHYPTGFVTKLNPTGTGLVYSTYLGGSVLDELTAIAIDAAGDAFVSGISFSPDFPTTHGAFQTINKSFTANGYNAVVTKMNPTGSGLIYSTYLGGGSSYGSTLGNIYWTNPIAVDKSGNAYVAGFTESGDFPVTTGAYQMTNHGDFNVTVSKLNSTATALLYSTYLGGSTDSICEGLAVDSAGNAYVAGYTSDTDFPVTKGAFQTENHADTNTSDSSDANQNGFVAKLNPAGSALVYSTYLGGSTGPWGGDQIYYLALDSSGDAYVAGSAMSADFPVTANAYQSKNRGATHCCDYVTYTSNAFLTELNPVGDALIYSTYLGGSGTQNPEGPGGSGDSAYGLALGKSGNAYVVGFTTSANFPVTEDAFETAYHTQQNTGFVADFVLGATPAKKESATALTPSANSVVPGTAVTFTAEVSPVSGAGMPSGTVVFSIDEKNVATVALNGAGRATYSTKSLAAGEHYVLASYSGNSTYAASGYGFNEIVTPLEPEISPPGGTYTSQQTVTITEPTRSAVLYYTLDGSAPSRFSPAYSGPITVNTSKELSAVAVAASDADSAVVTAAYTIVGSPAVLAAPATAIGTTGATLNAFVNTLGLAGSYLFKYGTSRTALTSSTGNTALAASSARAQASAQLTGLKSKTTYYYQVVVSTPGGISTGALLSFATK
jgi:hypothetical protein